MSDDISKIIKHSIQDEKWIKKRLGSVKNINVIIEKDLDIMGVLVHATDSYIETLQYAVNRMKINDDIDKIKYIPVLESQISQLSKLKKAMK